ncbi:MAG: hypothetical protein J7K20_02975 [Thermodesulfobacterium sp.]|nr:hypothetical protein [Thermodesulfobacterium sp.]
MLNDSIKYFRNLEELYKNFFRKKLKEDIFIKEKLESLLQAINNSRRAFIETGSFEFCAKCAEAGEKCCQAGLEWKLNKPEFFINLLLAEKTGSSIKFNLERPDDCLFLGEKGCTLILTPLFCRNFFCDKLSKFLGYNKLIKIQNAMEDEAIISFQLSDYINKKYIIPYLSMVR